MLGVFKRAYNSIRFRWVKNLFLFFILALITLLSAASYSVGKGIDAAIQSVNESIETSVIIRKEDAKNPYGYNVQNLYSMECAREIGKLSQVEAAEYVSIGNASGINVQGIFSSVEERFIDTEDYYEGDEELKNAGRLTVFGVEKLENAWPIAEMGDTLTSGTEVFGENGAVVSENFLRKNKLELGDEIELESTLVQGATVSLKIIGTHSGNYEAVYSCWGEENYIYTSLEMGRIISGDNVMETKYILKSAEEIDDFVQSADEILKKNNIKGNLIKDEMEYLLALNPLIGLKKMGRGMYLATIVIGLLILCIMECLIVFDRTQEIGILMSIGCNKRQIAAQMLVEMLIVVCFGTFAGLCGWNEVSSNLNNWLSNSADNMQNIQIFFYWEESMMQILWNLLLASIVSVIPCIFVLRYNLKKIVQLGTKIS